MGSSKQPYSKKKVTLEITIPEEFDQYLETLTPDKEALLRYLIESELYRVGMVNIQPKFDQYKDPFLPPDGHLN